MSFEQKRPSELEEVRERLRGAGLDDRDSNTVISEIALVSGGVEHSPLLLLSDPDPQPEEQVERHELRALLELECADETGRERQRVMPHAEA